MMHGMDIDLSSRLVAIKSFAPSKVDLISVKKSFIAIATMSTKDRGHYRRINIKECSIGVHVHLNAVKDLNLSGAILPPLTHVSSSIVQEGNEKRPFEFTSYELIKQEILMIFGYALMFGLFFCTLIPSFDLWNLFGNSIFVAIPALSTTLALQTVSWTLLFVCVQHISLINSRKLGKPANNAIYSVYNTMTLVYQHYSFLNILQGSPSFNLMMRLLGIKIKGFALLYPDRIFEYPFITITYETIIDGCSIKGHYVVYDDVTLGPLKLSGIIHEGTNATNASLTDEESGPLRAFVGGYKIRESNPTKDEETGL